VYAKKVLALLFRTGSQLNCLSVRNRVWRTLTVETGELNENKTKNENKNNHRNLKVNWRLRTTAQGSVVVLVVSRQGGHPPRITVDRVTSLSGTQAIGLIARCNASCWLCCVLLNMVENSCWSVTSWKVALKI